MITKDLILRKARYEDWESIYRNVWQHSEAARYMLWKVTESEEEAKDRIRRSVLWQESHYAWTVVEKISGECIGWGGFMEIAPGVYEDTGVCLGPDYVGKGYGKQILNALVDYVFTELSGNTFIGSARSQNLASIALQLSCGFSFSYAEERTDPRTGEPYTLNFYEIHRE